MTTSRFAGTLVRIGADPQAQTVDLGPPPDPAADRGCPVVLSPRALAWLLAGPLADRGGIDLATVRRVDVAYPHGQTVATVTFRDDARTVRRYGRDAELLLGAVRQWNEWLVSVGPPDSRDDAVRGGPVPRANRGAEGDG